MSKGSILIYTSAAGQAAPLPGVTLTVTDAGGSVRARLVTDADGFAEAADLPAPDAAYSLDAANTTVQPYALYRIEAALDGWQPLVLNGVQVFDAQQTVARLNLLPAGRVRSPDSQLHNRALPTAARLCSHRGIRAVQGPNGACQRSLHWRSKHRARSGRRPRSGLHPGQGVPS